MNIALGAPVVAAAVVAAAAAAAAAGTAAAGVVVAALPVGEYWLGWGVVEGHLSPRGFGLCIHCAVGWGCRRV